MQLSPAEKYPIVRQLDNINDTGTYFVQAVVKNAYTGTTLATVKLIDKGSQYFSALWTTPSDVNGNGTYITITTYVYTDAGYSIASTTYATESLTAVIQMRPTFPSGMGGGATDYGRIGRMLDERKTDVSTIDAEKLKREIVSVILDELKTIPRSYPSINIPKIDLDGAVQKIRERLDGMEKSNASLHEQAGQRFDSLATRHMILENGVGESMASMKKEVPDSIKKMIDSSLSEHAKKMDEIHASMKEMTEDAIDAAQLATHPIRFEFPRRQKEYQTDERVNKLLS